MTFPIQTGQAGQAGEADQTRMSQDVQAGQGWHRWFSEAIRLAVAPLVLFGSGFFTADFLLSGRYTWTQTSRAAALTLTVAILAYEFVYKEQRVRQGADPSDAGRPLKTLLYSCAIPYAMGALALLALARLAV